MNPDQLQENWQVEANGEIFDTNLTEMTSWIEQGTLLRIDRVRKGNLRWIEAGKVPSLISFFNAKDIGQPMAPTVTTTGAQASQPGSWPVGSTHQPTSSNSAVFPAGAGVCSMHPELPSEYICSTCANEFCRGCPNSYGGTVKVCPFCGAFCNSLAYVETHDQKEVQIRAAINEGFGFGDFGKALAHPFKFKASLIIGAIMYMMFSLGQSAFGFGGIFMLGGAVFCLLLANMLTVGILTNTVENFAQGKLDQNFMPSFDDFSIWDDVVHPFFLSVGVYLVSFGPLIAVALITVFMVVGAAKSSLNAVQPDASRTVAPGLPYAANAAKQSERVRELLKKNADDQQKRIAAIENGDQLPDEVNAAEPFNNTAQAEEERFEEINRMIQDQRRAQLESAVGKTPETVAKERSDFLSSIIGYGAMFLILGGITLLWGLFYFPAACAVAGYTRSFMATMNPAVGLDTIKRLGSSYALILVMGLLLLIASGIVGGILSVIFFPFDMPSVGNIPAKAVGSLFGFYLSVVFSCIIGYALFKASDRLELVR